MELKPQKGTQKAAMATHIMASAISYEGMRLLINKKWADSHFGAVYVSCICAFKKHYMKQVGQDLRRKADSAASNYVQLHIGIR